MLFEVDVDTVVAPSGATEGAWQLLVSKGQVSFEFWITHLTLGKQELPPTRAKLLALLGKLRRTPVTESVSGALAVTITVKLAGT